MKKSLSLLCASAMLLTLVLSGCGGTSVSNSGTSDSSSATPAASSTTTAQEPVELNYYMYNGNSQEYIDYFKNDIIKAFEDAHPGVTINLTLTGDPTGLTKQQIAAGGGPDIINVEPTTLQLFASANYLVPLDQYSSKYNWDKKFSSWATDTVKRDGKLMGLPGSLDGLVVYYNATLFEKNGWKVPANYEELIALCDNMKKQDIIPFAYGNSDFKGANSWWLSMGYNLTLGQQDFKKVIQGELPWDGQEMREATQKLMDMWKNGNIYDKSAGITLDDARTLFLTGKAGMFMSGQWDANPILGAAPGFDWNVFQMPSWKDGVESVLPIAVGATFCINSHCENPDVAAAFLDWNYSDKAVTDMLSLGTIYPTNNCDLNSVKGIDPKIIGLDKMILDAQNTGKIGYCSWTYWPANVDTYSWNNLDALYLGQITLDEYIKNLESNYKLDVQKGNGFKF